MQAFLVNTVFCKKDLCHIRIRIRPESVRYALNHLILQNKSAAGVFVDGGAHGRGSNGRSAPMGRRLLAMSANRQAHGTNTPDVGSRIQLGTFRFAAGLSPFIVTGCSFPIVTTFSLSISPRPGGQVSAPRSTGTDSATPILFQCLSAAG